MAILKKLGKYELLKKLGEGASSTVYLGRDPFAQRQVAIKVATPEALSNPKTGKLYTHLFLNEASLVGKLRHPHITQIYDAVVSEKLCYIVMEYVAGGTLEEHATLGHLLAVDRVIELIFKCTRALAFAHRIGLTHRDIKPANLLLTADSEIKISDFGAAINNQNDRTQVSAIGSPAYMSPEQILELPLDQRTDIYSLGVVMFQLLTGRLPFEASNQFNMINQIMHDDAPKPSALRPKLPPMLDAIVGKAMCKDRDARYQTWEAFARDLAEAVRNHQRLAPSAEFADTEKFDTLRALPFFTKFSDVEIWETLRFSQWQHVAPGTVIMHDGEAGDFFCFLAAGQLQVSKAGKALSILTQGECFGEMAAINPQNPLRSADVAALGPVDIITVRGEALQQASEGCRMRFYESFLKVMASRLISANQREISF
ncbi:MAG: serine/threonine protein kinase [Betaproteobacteria bacterium HGW-Betaproteobacteria-10]|nr:MAG: serine/threonine protein kinase [Betaproteobacteria bacterium HGW-Betaproteobacteria-10]